MEFEHVLPQLGLVKIRLYPPADEIYRILKEGQEVHRLTTLRHLGSISQVMPGTRQARWDYTVALLHFSSKLDIHGFKSRFKINGIEFSSAIAALQCLSLLWNTGHFPGTFSTEKGIFRHLVGLNRKDPAALIGWPHAESVSVQRIIRASSKYLLENDYQAVCRIYSIYKCLLLCESDSHDFFKFITDFYAPFILDTHDNKSIQWEKLKKSFQAVRHIAYTTLDVPFSGLKWSPNIPSLMDFCIEENKGNIGNIFGQISEVLSPIERSIYASIYHRERSRFEMARCSNLISEILKKKGPASIEISKWLSKGLYKDLKTGGNKALKPLNHCVSIKIRSHFFYTSDISIYGIELDLHRMGFDLSACFKYQAWNSDDMLEPDELIIDVLVSRPPLSKDLGRVMSWFSDKFDKNDADVSDVIKLIEKGVAEEAYAQMISRAIEIFYPGVTLKLISWPLRNWGIFSQHQVMDGKGKIWACRSSLDDKLISSLLRNRSRSIDSDQKDQYAELLGIKKLREVLKAEMGKGETRCRWLFLTCSVVFCKDDKDLIEYDGGLLRISSRTGKLTWYGLESKNGKENPTRSLSKRLGAIGIKKFQVKTISEKYAYVEMPLE